MLDYEKERKELIAKHTANVRKWNKNNPNHRISGVMPEGYKPPKEYKKSVTQWDFTQKRKATEQKKKKSVTKNSVQPKMNKVSNRQVNIQTGKYKTNNSKEFREKKGTGPLSNGKKDTKLYDQVKGAGKSSKAGERVKNTVKGTSKQIGGQYLNAAVTPFAGAKISAEKVKAQNDLGGAAVRKEPVKGNSKKYDTTYYKTRKQVEQEKKEQAALKKQTQAMQKNFEQGIKQTQNTASALRQSGAKDIEKAKKGLGTAGKFGIDLASQMMMWGGDAAIGAVTGTGLLTPMFVRSFGDASMTARESGATHGQQMFAGVASGSVEVATEKLFSPYKIFKKTAGAGVADNLVEKASYKIANKIAVKLSKSGVPSNVLYKAIKNTVKAGAGMAGEGTEEVLADLAQPLYERSYDKDSLKQYGTKEYWQNVGRDFGMGAAMAGVLGGSSGIINKTRGSNSSAHTNQPYTDKEKAQAIKAAKAQGEETKAYKYALELENQQKNGKEILDAQVDDLAQRTFQEQYEAQKAIIEQQEKTEHAKMAAMQEMAGETDSFMNDHMTNIEAQAVNEVISRRVGNNARRIADSLVNVFHADPEIAASQAESIARIKTGTATAADLNVGAVTNIEARSVLQRELKTKLPATNAETIKKLAEYAGTARAVQKPGILKEARQSARAEMFQVFTQGMDDTTADIFSDGMEKVQIADMPKYMEAFATYYQGGRVNYAYDRIPIAKQYKGYITESIKMAAYNAGNQIYQAEQVQAAEAQKNIVKGERKNGSLEISDKSIRKIGKEQANALRMMTEVGGKKVVVLDQIDAGSRKDVANGKYQDGTIYISAKSEAPIFDVLKHELTHNLQETAPEAYNELKQYVFQKFYESDRQKYDVMVHNMIERYAKSGVELTRAQAEDELLADATDVFFKDADAIQDLVNENRSLGEKLLDGIRSLLDTLHRMATGSYSDEKKQSKGEWLETIGIVEEAERLWVKALNESIGVDTKENYKAKYSFAGISAQNADNKMLSVAKAMASKGESSEKIRKETGWHKGHDGKWRFEIDDSQMEVFTAGDAQFRKGHPEYVRLQELYDKFWDSDISEGEQKELRQLEDTWGDEYGRLHERLRSGDARLGDILKHDLLFENYPFLENIRVRLENIAGENAHYNPGRNEIVINKDLFESSYRNEQRNTTLIHEIQHAIQQMESFASGATPDYYQDKTTKRIEDLKTRIASKEIILSGREDGLLDTVDRMGFDSDEMNMEKLHQEIYDFLNESGRSDLVEFAKETFETKAKELDGLRVELRDLEKSAPAEMYTNTAGEVEARDAGKRAGMSASERKETRPDIDKDVVFAEDFARYQLKDQEIKPFEMSKKQVLENMQKVTKMDAVSDLSLHEFNDPDKRLFEQVLDYYNSIGGSAWNETLGEISLTKRGIKESWAHRKSVGKPAAFKSVPEVIENGQIIDAQYDWKGRGYNTVVLAAPITIDGEPYYEAVVVKRVKTNGIQRFNVHDLELIKTEQTAPAQALKRTPDNSTAPIYNLLQQLNNVNNLTEKDIVSDEGKFQLKEQEIKPFEMDKKQILSNMRNVAEMDSVCSLNGEGFESEDGKKLSDAIMESYGNHPFMEHNKTLGDVRVSKRGIKSSTQHKPLYGTKIEGFKAIREVIREGEVIHATKNYNNKKYDRVIVAAPVQIGENQYYMGVIINRSQKENLQNYYIHDVVLAKRNSPAIKDSVTTSGLRVDRTVSPYIILQQLNNINNLTEKDVFSDEGKFQLKDQQIKPFEMSKKQVLDNMKFVAEMNPVATLTGNEFAKGSVDLITQVSDFFDEIGNIALNPVLGEVEVNRNGVKSSIGHGIGRLKAIAFKAVPEVISKGEIIDTQFNWKDRGYDTIVIAASVKIGDGAYYIGTVINRNKERNTQHYYLHEVGIVKKNSMPSKTVASQSGGSHGGNTAPIYNLLQQLNNVNNLTEKDIVSDEGKFQLKDENEQLRKQLSAEKELSKKLKAEFKRSKYATPDPKQSGKAVNKLIETYLGKRDARLHQSIMQDIEQVYKEMRKTEGNWNLVDDLCRNVADKIVSNMEILHDDMWNQYTDLRKTLRNTTIKLTEAHWNDIADFEDLRKSHFGTVKLSKQNGVSIDTFYQELAETYPELFDAAEYTNEVDQLYNILDVVDGMKPYTEDYSSGEIAEFADSIAKDVLQMSYDLAQKKTFADIKFDEKQKAVEKVKVERNSMMQKQRERMQKRIEKKDNFYRQKIADVKQKYKDRNDRKYYTKRIEAYAQWMSDALLRPNDTKHLPDGYAKAIATMLEGFDFSTQRSDAYTEKNGPSKRTLRFTELRNAYEEMAKAEDGTIEVDEEVQKMLVELSTALDGQRFADLNIDQLKGVYRLIKQIRFSLSTINKTFSEGLRKNVSDYGNSVIAETGSIRHKNRTGTKHSAGEFLTLSNTTPWDAFTLMGDTMGKLYQNMRNGFDRHVKNASAAMDFIQGLSKQYNVKSWIDDNAKPQSFVVGGRKIELVPSQIMSLYCLMQREQAMKHIIEGSGMTAAPLPVIDKKRQKMTKAWSQRVLDSSHVIPTMEEVNEIISTLTSEQRKVADALQKFMNETCSDWGNETSLKLYGYKKFGEKNYFPIKSSDAFLAESFDSKMNPSKIKNVGFTKNTVMNAHNPIVLDDIFSVFTQHVNTMSMYNALVPAITDFERVFNYKQREGGKQVSSVHGSLQQAFGNGAVNYITQFMKDVNQNYVKNRDHALANKLVANYKKAKIGANFRVLFQQPTAITRAMAVMSPKYLIAAIPNVKSIPGLAKKARMEMQEHNAIARWKSWGFYNTDIARDMRDIFLDRKNIVDKMFMDMYGAADDFTWSIIWRATKKEIKATKPDLTEGSDAYWKAVNERFSYIVDRTQVVDSVFHRSQIMRKQDLFSKTITSFMAEPTKTWNLLKTEYTLAGRELKAGNKVAAAKRISRVTATHLVTAAFTASAAALIDALRGAGEDDDDKDFLEKWKSYTGQGFIDNVNPINLLPGLRDVTSLIQGYDVSRMDMAGMADLINSLQYWQSDTTTPYYALKKTVGGIASITGLPVGSLWRDVESIAKETAKLFVPEEKVEFVMKQLRYNINDSRNRSKFAKVYAKAEQKGNAEIAVEIRSKMLDQGADEKKWDQSVKTQQKNLVAARVAKQIVDGNESKAKEMMRSYCSQNEWEYEKMWPKAMAEAEKRKSIFQKAYDETLKKLILG